MVEIVANGSGLGIDLTRYAEVARWPFRRLVEAIALLDVIRRNEAERPKP